MKINISQKLGLSAALVVSIVGCFSESAEAGRFRVSGQSDHSLEVDFILDTDKPFSGAIENFTAIKEDNSENLVLNDRSPSGTVMPSQFTDSELDTLADRLEMLDIIDNIDDTDEIEFDSSNVIEYDLRFTGLPDYNGTLYIPYRNDDERDDLVASLAAFDDAFDSNEDIREEGIPGIFIRDFVPEADADTQKITINGVDKAVDIFGVAGQSGPFKVEKVNIPEPTTAAGLLAALAVGGLSLRKGDKLKGHGSSDRRVKSKAII
ncbi:MAG: PEP-CTERM sorting domain-containing protein [Cyanobacteria bacterium J06635_10]